MRWKIGRSVKEIDEDLVRQHIEAGIEVLELSLPKAAYKSASDYTMFKNVITDAEADYKAYKKCITDSEIELRSFHLPFHPGKLNDPAGLGDEIFNTTVDIQKLMIEKSGLSWL